MEWLDEGRIEYDNHYAFMVVFDYLDFRIQLSLQDEWNATEETIKETGIKILKVDDDGNKQDVTTKFFIFDAKNHDFQIRPTLDNVREIMRILEENDIDYPTEGIE
jgi:hypothetical protein